MADTVGPESLSTKGIPSARRGYDRRAVEQVMAAAAAQWEQLVEEHRELLERIDRAGGLEYLSADLGALADDVGRMLTEAQRAAAGIRDRAAADAEEQVGRARDEAGQTRSAADAAAYEARRRAWEEGTALLEDAMRTAAAMVERAEADVLIIRAEAEQEAHRRVAAARKEGADIVRNARFEADRLVTDAKALADDLVGGAMREAEAAQERARALETRRRRMLDEMEGERTEATPGIRVVQPTGPPSRPAAPTPPAPRRADSEVDALGDSLAEEVERLQGEARRRVPEPQPRQPEPAPQPRSEPLPRPAVAGPEEPWLPEDGDGTVVVHGRAGAPLPPPEPAEPAPVEAAAEVPEEPAAEVPEEPAAEVPEEPAAEVPEEPAADAAVDRSGEPAAAPAVEGAGEPEAGEIADAEAGEREVARDEPAAGEPAPAEPPGSEPAGSGPAAPPVVDDLFARLRGGTAAPEPASAPARQEAVTEPAAAVPDEAAAVSPAEPPGIPAVPEPTAEDPIELRDRLLLPVENRGLRRVKQGLLEAQNLVLEALRVSGAWSGGFEELGSSVGGVVEEAAGAGAAAAGAFTGRAAPAPVIGERSALVAGDLAAAVQAAVEAELEATAGAGPRERAAAVSRVFRAWRGEEAERWVRLAARTAFHDSLLAGLASLGVSRVAAVPHGGTCDRCPVGAGSWDPGGAPPEGRAVPPAGLDCHCALAPAG